MRKYITDDDVGKLARKRRGFFGGIVGKIAKTGSHYAIEFASGSRVVIVTTDDIDFIDEEAL